MFKNEFSTLGFTGIDGSGKTSATNNVARMLGQDYRVLVLSSLRHSPYILDGETKQNIFENATEKLAKVYEKGQQLKSSPLIFAAFIARAALEGHLIQPYAAKHSADFIVQDRNRSIDSIVIFWAYVQKGLPVELMARTVESLTGRTTTDLLFWLNIDPEIAAERKSPDSKPDHHESAEKLTKMHENYRLIIPKMVQSGRISHVVSIDTGKNDRQQTAQIAYKEALKLRR